MIGAAEPTEVTVGIDIGTTSVKAVAADADGRVLARARIPHELYARGPGELAHDARRAWHDGVQRALAEVARSDLVVRGVDVAAMVPSMCAVDADGVPVSPGLLYGDDRGRGGDPSLDPSQSGEAARLAGWLAANYPEAAGYWPAQAVANRALGGPGAVDTVVAMTMVPLFDYTGWDAGVAASHGLHDTSCLPALSSGNAPIGKVAAAHGAALGPGAIDAFAEQLVAGADSDGDVLVILGSTLIVWVVVPEWKEVPKLWTVPHTTPGKVLIGGPSNAGGLFVGWVRRLLAAPLGAPSPPPGGSDTGPGATAGATRGAAPVVSSGVASAPVGPAAGDPSSVPVWQPFLRGERVPLHDPDRRASLHDVHIGHDAAAVMRGAYEASGFAARHLLDLADAGTRRIVCTGGGSHDGAWVRALADATHLPVDVVASPEGGALGAAFLARVAAGLEDSPDDARRWAAVSRRVEPSSDPAAAAAVAARYRRYRELAG